MIIEILTGFLSGVMTGMAVEICIVLLLEKYQDRR